jgi:hypothetical protein
MYDCTSMKKIYVIILLINLFFSQSLKPDAILKNTYYSAMSSMRGHAHTTYQKTPLNAFFNPAGLAGLKKQIGLVDMSTYMNTKEFPDSETYYSISLNSIMLAAPFSSNARSFVLGFSIRAPLLNSYEYTNNNDLLGGSYSESYQYYQYGFTFAQRMSNQVKIGFTYSTLTGTTKIEEKSADTFTRKRKDEIKILESPTMIIFGLQYMPIDDLLFGLTWQSGSNMRLKDTRLNDKNGYNLKTEPVFKIGTKYHLGDLTDLYMDYHRVNRPDNALNSINTGFDFDIFEDLGFGLGAIFYEPLNFDRMSYTGGISFNTEHSKYYISVDYSTKNRRPYYFNHTESTQYLVQGTVEHYF